MAKLITLGKEFQRKSADEQVNYLHKLASSQNQALDMMQNERDALLQKCSHLERQLANSEQNLQIQKKIVMDNITQGNADRQSLIEQNQALGERVRAQDGVIERLNGCGDGS